MEATHEVGHQVAVRSGGRLLAVYRYGDDTPKPYFHPVELGTGSEAPLTLLSPHDHSHHRGLWFCWKFVNGENFWEERPACHRVRTTRLDVDLDTRDCVRWESELRWELERGGVLLTERRVLAIGSSRGAGERVRYPIDFDLAFTPAVPVVELRLLTVRERPSGGYAGLGYRPARGMDVNGRLVTSQGAATTADKGKSARWADYSGELDGAGTVGGLAVFDHPRNVRHPPPFFVLGPPGFGFLNPSPLFHEGLTLASGETLRLRYRVLVHEGSGDPDDLEGEYRRWVAEHGDG
jgi:hypothetical protein